MAARRLPIRADPAPNPPRRRVRVTFDGKAFEAFDGEPLAAGVLDLPGTALDGRVLQVGKRRFRRLRVV